MICETNGQVLSDVHTYLPARSVCISDTDLSESRFCFKLPKLFTRDTEGEDREKSAQSCWNEEDDELDCNKAADANLLDEDGDLIVKRATTEQESRQLAITVVHAMATDLNMVGQQVWLGALLLCDFMLHYGTLLKDNVVLDLGAGVGLTSIVASLMAKTVFCTDYGEEILALAKINVERNSGLLSTGMVHVRQIDWKAAKPLETDIKMQPGISKQFRLNSEDVDSLSSCSVILAAEVVYDNELTDAFFCLLYNLLLKQPAKTVYMTVEKRLVYTIGDKDVVSPAYDHFYENLQDLCSVDEGPTRFLCSQVNTSFPQYFNYQRTKELELWKIETIHVQR